MKLKKGTKVFLIILAVLIVAGAVAYFLMDKEEQKQRVKHDRLSDEEMLELRAGDIVLRQGFGIISDLISSTLDEEYTVSHCAIVDVDSATGKMRIIHSVSSSLSDFDGLQDVSIKEFCRESMENSLLVVRFRDTNNIPLANLALTARKYLDQRIPFDNSFDFSDKSEMYCSEMVANALLETFGYDIYPNKDKEEVIKFAPFFDTTHFRVIINHHKK